MALLGSTLMLLALASPILADHKQLEYEGLVRWAGCTADLVTSDEHHLFESSYTGSHVLYIGTDIDSTRDPNIDLLVLFHEIGHCLQVQEGLTWEAYAANTKLWELDADMRSANIACSLGMDGKRMLHDAFTWVYATYGYAGDPNHGTLTERIHQGHLAPLCNLAEPPQSPFTH